METMTVGDFKANFSEVLKKVLNGEEVAISYGKRKEIVARLVPGSGEKKQKLEFLKLMAKLYSRKVFPLSLSKQ
jgi:antitoxin (DNA-binding transcriptional repressor) of toxin-antitoxin stability system